MVDLFLQMEEIWPLSDSDDEQTPLQQNSPVSTESPLWQFLFFLLFWQSFFKVSITAFTALLRFLKQFIHILGKAFVSPQLEEFSSAIPIRYEDVLLHTGVSSNDFIEYVVCPSCHSVYDFQDCIESVGREKRPKTCSHVPYPNHPHRSRRQPCGASLIKTV